MVFDFSFRPTAPPARFCKFAGKSNLQAQLTRLKSYKEFIEHDLAALRRELNKWRASYRAVQQAGRERKAGADPRLEDDECTDPGSVRITAW